jgi:putative transposase
MIYPVVAELATGGLEVAACCRMLRVSAAGFYEWRARKPSARHQADEQLTTAITGIHQASRASYGAPRVHAELRLGQDIRCGRKRVERLMRQAGLGRDLPPQIQGLFRPGAGRHRASGSGEPPVHRRRPGPAVGHRHHPAPHRPGPAVLRRGL